MTSPLSLGSAQQQARERSRRPGLWVVLEGGDGCGKTTQAGLLVEALRSALGSECVTETFEPGNTVLGRSVRRALLHGGHVTTRAEALLYAADRAHHVETVVLPALKAGNIVIQTRYIDSSVVYQGTVRGLGEGTVESLSLWAANGELPDLTVVLDTPSAFAREREMDRVERETAAASERIREGFLARAAADTEGRYLVLDASRPREDVAWDLVEAVTARLHQPAESAAAAR